MDPIFIARVLVCAFFAACFLQSGIDKVVDWKGNLAWLTGHFAKTPLKGAVTPMLAFVTLLELVAGIVCGVGAVTVAIGKGTELATIGLGLAALALTMLFTGQRIAKDYPGASTLATYFGVTLIGLFIMR